MRLKIIRLSIFALFFVIAVELFYVQVIRGQYFFNLSVNNRIRVVPVSGQRGRIQDKNGIILADNRPSFNIAVIPQDIKESDELFSYLSGILKVEKKELLQRFFRRKVTPFAPVLVAEDIQKRVAMVLEENKFRFPGLHIPESYRRHYPFRETGAHVLGYVGKISRAKIEKLKGYGYSYQSTVGYSGIEENYDYLLMGREGGSQIEVNSRGQQVRLLSVREAENGEDIQLTIDHRLQQLAGEVLGDKRGTIIVMDLDTGGIRGMVSSPSYDPNIFIDRKLQHKIGFVFADASAPLLNRAIKGLYPPGSVFKTIVTAAGLTTGSIKPQTSFYCKGSYKLGRRRFRCAHTHGTQNLIEALLHSCNVYFYNAGLEVGPDNMHKFARLFGLGSLTHIDLPFEEKGSIPSRIKRKIKRRQGWSKGDTLNSSIGQGEILVTPLQMVRMMATVARKGQEVQPHLLQGIGGKKVVKVSTARNVRIKEEVFDIIQSGLRLAVTEETGTAHLLDSVGLGIAGKTGTAQSVPGRGPHAWFVGYTTEGKERIAFCVFLEYGGSSANACLLARQLLQRMKKEEML